VVARCAAAAAETLGVVHAVGYVDVCEPTLEEALGGLAGPVVVPFFLASGYHVRHDVPSAVAATTRAVVTPALGAEPEVIEALADRVLAAAAARDADPPSAPSVDPLTVDAVLVTGAGSSVDSARAEVALVSRLLGERLDVVTGTAYLSGPGPRPAQEIARLRAAGHERVVLAAHLLSPGHFLDRAHATARELGALPADALGTHPALVALVVRRYLEATAS
jgi:sirohydrochlorin ferrochelatase